MHLFSILTIPDSTHHNDRFSFWLFLLELFASPLQLIFSFYYLFFRRVSKDGWVPKPKGFFLSLPWDEGRIPSTDNGDVWNRRSADMEAEVVGVSSAVLECRLVFGLSGTIEDSNSASGKISLLHGEIPVDPIPELMFCGVG